MRPLLISRPVLGMVLVLIIADMVACGSASAARPPATPLRPTATVPFTPTPMASPTVGSSPATAAVANPWQLIYSDDFNGTQLNGTWGVYNGPHGGGQSQYDPSEVSVSNGLLHLGIDHKTTNGLPYTSGGVAAFRLAQTYGKYEFRVKLPYGKGINPYTILWPNTPTSDVETDIFESPPPNKDTLYFTNHGGPGGTSSQLRVAGAFAAGFHIIACEWTPGRLHLLVDGVDEGSLTVNVPNQPMWFGMAVSSGDAFTGLPDPTTAMPVSLDVDWVHIYRYTG